MRLQGHQIGPGDNQGPRPSESKSRDTDEEISEAVGCSISTAYRMRKRDANDGIKSIHRRSPDQDYERKLDGQAEARLIALVWGPAGRPHPLDPPAARR